MIDMEGKTAANLGEIMREMDGKTGEGIYKRKENAPYFRTVRRGGESFRCSKADGSLFVDVLPLADESVRFPLSIPQSSAFHFSLRVVVHSVVSTKYFEMVVMAVICMSSISLAAEDPVDEDNPRNRVLQYMDYCFTGVFACEMLLKVGI
jgi:hypothetical protein